MSFLSDLVFIPFGSPEWKVAPLCSVEQGQELEHPHTPDPHPRHVYVRGRQGWSSCKAEDLAEQGLGWVCI